MPPYLLQTFSLFFAETFPNTSSAYIRTILWEFSIADFYKDLFSFYKKLLTIFYVLIAIIFQ